MFPLLLAHHYGLKDTDPGDSLVFKAFFRMRLPIV